MWWTSCGWSKSQKDAWKSSLSSDKRKPRTAFRMENSIKGGFIRQLCPQTIFIPLSCLIGRALCRPLCQAALLLWRSQCFCFSFLSSLDRRKFNLVLISGFLLCFYIFRHGWKSKGLNKVVSRAVKLFWTLNVREGRNGLVIWWPLSTHFAEGMRTCVSGCPLCSILC